MEIHQTVSQSINLLGENFFLFRKINLVFISKHSFHTQVSLLQRINYTLFTYHEIHFSYDSYACIITTTESSVLVTLTPSIQRQCINVDIDQENFSKNTTVVISKYKLPPFATLSPRTAAIITRPSNSL